MKIVRPYARLVPKVDIRMVDNFEFTRADGIELLRRIEWAARISHRAEDMATDISYERFIRFVVTEKGDFSVIEHATVSVDMVVDRGITHEWVRHRLFGFTQESTRFVNYEKKMEPSFIYPQVDVQCPDCLSGSPACDDFGYRRDQGGNWIYEHLIAGGTEHGGTQYPCVYNGNWIHSIFEAEDAYKKLIKSGWRPQEARSVFPNALASRIVTTGNLRMWRHVLLMRTTQEAHPQMRQVTIPLLEEFKAKIPILFDDIEPNAKQSDNMKKMR